MVESIVMSFRLVELLWWIFFFFFFFNAFQITGVDVVESLLCLTD